MNSLGIVARAVLMENGLYEAEGESKKRKALKYGAVAAGLGGLGYGVHRFMQGGSKIPTFAEFEAGKTFTPNRYTRVSNLAKRGYDAVASKFTPENIATVKKYGKYGLGAAGIGAAGYGGYKLYKHIQAKRAASKAAREAYYAVYMNLMEADQDQKPSFARKWGGRALKGAALYGAAHGVRGAALMRGRGVADEDTLGKVGRFASGAASGVKKAFLNPINANVAAYRQGKNVLKQRGLRAIEKVRASRDKAFGGDSIPSDSSSSMRVPDDARIR